MRETKGGKVHRQLGHWHGQAINVLEYKKYKHITQYRKGWGEGLKRRQFELFLTHGSNHKNKFFHILGKQIDNYYDSNQIDFDINWLSRSKKP